MDRLTKNQHEDLNASYKTTDFKCGLSMRNGSGDSPLFELADRLRILKEEKKQKELELRNISDMLTEFIGKKLKMELNEQKTLTTHSNQYAQFLGYNIHIRCDD